MPIKVLLTKIGIDAHEDLLRCLLLFCHCQIDARANMVSPAPAKVTFCPGKEKKIVNTLMANMALSQGLIAVK